MSLKIIDSMWISGLQIPGVQIGLVITENEIGVKKLRAGLAAGLDVDKDMRLIASHGGRLSKRALLHFLERVDE